MAWTDCYLMFLLVLTVTVSIVNNYLYVFLILFIKRWHEGVKIFRFGEIRN